MKVRHALLLAGVVGAGGLLWLDGPAPADDLAVPVARPAPRPSAAATAASTRTAAPSAGATEPGPDAAPPLADLQPRPLPERDATSRHDLFAAKSWAPPPAPPAPASAALAVAAPPPLPFQYVGRQRSGGNEQVFLAEGEQLHVVQVHSVIRGTYRIDQMVPGAVVLTYLPMNLTQRLPTGTID